MKPLMRAWCIGGCLFIVYCGNPTPLDRQLTERKPITIDTSGHIGDYMVP